MLQELFYGLKNGKLVHISEVDRGLACNCICPACKKSLIARKGGERIHHFAHYNHADCGKSNETTAHMLAKKILENNKKMRLPKVEIVFNSHRENMPIFDRTVINFDDVKLEHRIDDIIPDVVIYVKDRPLLIEITVTNKTKKKKMDKIKRKGISCLEIDLSFIRKELSYEELEEIIINMTYHKKWLYNQKANYYKRLLLKLSERKPVIIKQARKVVTHCPTLTKIYNEKKHANVLTDCMHCLYCVHHDDQFIYCTGKKEIATFEDLRNHINRIQRNLNRK